MKVPKLERIVLTIDMNFSVMDYTYMEIIDAEIMFGDALLEGESIEIGLDCSLEQFNKIEKEYLNNLVQDFSGYFNAIKDIPRIKPRSLSIHDFKRKT